MVNPEFVIPQTSDVLDFHLPSGLEASVPPEARGLRRDDVRLMISYRATGEVHHTRFGALPEYLHRGDVLVINTSKTLNAALVAIRADGRECELHLSSRLPTNEWTIELRGKDDKTNRPLNDATSGERIQLPAGAMATLIAPYPRASLGSLQSRLWVAQLDLPSDLYTYLNSHGFPIRYSYVSGQWPLTYYQTVYASEPGSAEMPSAGRAFTPDLITKLVAQGVQFAPLLLHTGVASLESHEPPYEEYFQVTEDTAQIVNAARADGRRVIAVGTTSIRALETVAEKDNVVRAREGWTSLVITRKREMRVVDGLLTGLHEPKATHLAMLESLAGRDHLEITYTAALQHGYLWHEFGDLHLILP